ncbi:ABC-type transport auxiliary lipoprotein family protein [Methylobrevis pamukkalensis]|uniref:ABC-type transport auxiliary lipoprotein component domain-containing protein n=1 Tax=Methylobrevis pamukkalensis TaxID=1439726 RepID=A0A1E3H569_9HYPH|nr:ABC-type transport auxiliary lipoprotein family protein [Methylobrevis pamukkalensis]ODN71464.1 hypothetical protein A6302_01242 [Methylobrevis pamukkalensis]
MGERRAGRRIAPAGRAGSGEVRCGHARFAGARFDGGLRRLGSVMALSLLVAGCSTVIGGSSKAPAIYDLGTRIDFAGLPPGKRTAAQLLIPKPAAIQAIDTQRIVVNPTATEISYFPDVQWSDELPELLQVKLVRAFEDSGRAKAVGRPGESLAIDYQVVVDIRDFAFEVEPSPAASVILGVKLLDDTSGKVVATRVFTVRAPAANDAAASVVTAFDSAASQAIREVVVWTVGVI